MARVLRLQLLLGIIALAGFPIQSVSAEEEWKGKGAGIVTAVVGPVMVLRPTATPRPLKFRDDLYWHDLVEAGQDGIARVLLAGKMLVTVRELSRLELREELLPEGVRYAVELASGKVRAAVARMLMLPGEQLYVRTRNAVASVRGTDFIVETFDPTSPQPSLGPLGAPGLAEAVAGGGSTRTATVVVTLSGSVEVWNPLSGTGRVERIGAGEGARVVGTLHPVRFAVGADELKGYLKGLTPPRPMHIRKPDITPVVWSTIEQEASARLPQPTTDPGDQGQGSTSGGDQGSTSGNGEGQASPGGPGSNSASAQASAAGAAQATSAGGDRASPLSGASGTASGRGSAYGWSGSQASTQGTGVASSWGGGPATGLAGVKGSSGPLPSQGKK